MISRLLSQLVNSVGIVFRTFRAFFTRQIAGIVARFRRLTSFSRQAAKLVPKAMSSAAVATQKPTKREDYIETKRLFIAKSLLVIIVLVLVAGGLLIYFVGWPWAQSRFFTAHMYHQAEKAQGYTGKAVLYYDEEKDVPMLEGRLEEGVLEGTGRAYDENGIIRYAGGFAGGIYDGKGKLYEKGELVYDGGFSSGKYEGDGILYEDGLLRYEGKFAGGKFQGAGSLYEKGELCYTGEFLAGVFEGSGTAYENAALRYKGMFAQGLYEGEGTLYGSQARIIYRGGFLQGLYDGEGTLYDEQGNLHYVGGFAGGEYQGPGKLYMAEGLAAETEFERGSPAAQVQLYLNGKLYYDGEAEEYLPHGTGVLYAGDGTAVYTGLMIRGAIDSGALLGKTAEEAREAFADAQLKEVRGTKAGFSIQNEALGVTLFSSLKTESAEPTVCYVYQYNKGTDAFFARLWQAALAAAQDMEEPESRRETVEKPDFTGLVPFAKVDFQRDAAYYKTHIFVAWREQLQDDPVMLEWISGSDLPGKDASGGGAGGGAGRLDNLLGDLGLAPAAGTKGGANPYYGVVQPDTAVASATLSQSPEKLEQALTPMLEYLENAEAKDALDEAGAAKQAQLRMLAEQFAMGKAEKPALDAVSTEVNALELRTSRATVGMEKAKLSAKDVTEADLTSLDLQKLLWVMDPAKIDSAQLLAEVEKSSATKAEQAKLALLELELAYQEIKQAQELYTGALAAVQQVQSAYEMGSADVAAKADADAALCEAKIALYAKLCAFTKQMLALNTTSAHWLAMEYGYYQGAENALANTQKEGGNG